MHSPTAILIGSGIAGMAVAIRLASKGWQVQVYEKNSYPGGKLHAFEQDGYQFDAGPSLFTQPENVEDLFRAAEQPITDYFNYCSVDIACKYFFENGKRVNAYTNSKLFAEEMKDQLNESPEQVLAYLEASKKLYNSIGEIFINNSLHKRSTWLNKGIIRALGKVQPKYLLNTLNQYNKRQFKSPEATQLFNRFATYNGSDPYQTPAMLSLIPHLEQNQGTFYPAGGMISITKALYELALEKGVVFRFNAAVEQILQKNGKATGVVADGQQLDASIVISNSDVYYTYKNLLNLPARAQKVLKQERSSSAVIFYWGIKKNFTQLGLHNIFFSKDYKHEFDCIFKKKTLSPDPTIYVNITAKLEPSHAPAGKENWFVMVNAPANTGQPWEELKRDLKINVLNKLSRLLGEPIEPLIETEQTLDPVKIQDQSASYMGSLYGTSSNSRFAAFLRHANFTSTIHGLYFCGGSVHPGGGIPLCLKSAKIVSELIPGINKTQRYRR